MLGMQRGVSYAETKAGVQQTERVMLHALCWERMARAPPQACTVSCHIVKVHINASMLGVCNSVSVTVTHYVKSGNYVLGVLCWSTSFSGADV